MAHKALIFEVVRVEADAWVIAVLIIEPHLIVMHYISQFFPTDLTQPTINGYPLIDKSAPCFLPRSAFIKFFLGQSSQALQYIPTDPPLQSLLFWHNKKRTVPLSPVLHDTIIPL
jgi:hypothetical protein